MAGPFVDVSVGDGRMLPPMSEADFRMYVVRELTAINTHLEDLCGNGQPGRIAKIESILEQHQQLAAGVGDRERRIKSLEGESVRNTRFRWMATGAIAAVTALIGWLISIQGAAGAAK